MLELQFFFLEWETSANEMSNVLAIVLFWFVPNTIIDINKVQRKPLNVYRFAQNSSPEAFYAYDRIFFRFKSDWFLKNQF